MKKIGFLALILWSGTASCAVPYTFTAGTPAKASEVNANFQNLDGRVKTLENKSSAGAGTGSDGDAIYAHSLTYAAAGSTIGQEFTIGGITYRIIRVPVKTPNGKIYALTYPAELKAASSVPDGAASHYAASTISISHTQYPFTQTDVINGFPAALTVNDYFYFSTSGKYSNSGGSYGYWDQSYWVTFYAQGQVRIDLNGSHVSIHYLLSETQKQQTGIDNSASDFTSVDLSAVQDNLTMVGHLDQLIDYIKIEELP